MLSDPLLRRTVKREKINIMITNIRAIDRVGNEQEFIVTQEKINEAGYDGIRYQVRTTSMSIYAGFFAVILFLPNNRILQYLLVNNDIPEVKGKGIIKALMKAVSKEFKQDILSSTNLGHKISHSEGRVPDMDKAWKKWTYELSNVEYLPAEERFIYRYEPTS